MEGGIYIHVPFCRSRCIYCDFFSTTLGEDWQSLYVKALCREMRLRVEEAPFSRVRSLYIGGGTPSVLSMEAIHAVFRSVADNYSLAEDAEVTIEANPDDVTGDWLAGIKDTPVNRISMGVQTFSDDILRALGRRHTSLQVECAVSGCYREGYENLSLDLIYGLPGQTVETWTSDVRKALSSGVPHLSAYSLSFENGTALASMLRRGEVEEVDDEVALCMYRILVEKTAKAGMRHYEISNFCKEGMHSRHNSGYWTGTPYLGFGPGAHSYDGKRMRRANDGDVRLYVTATDGVPHSTETLSDDELYDELVMTRMRTAKGLPLSLLDDAQKKYCLAMAAPHLNSGKLVAENGFLHLTEDGIFVSNDIISDLMR